MDEAQNCMKSWYALMLFKKIFLQISRWFESFLPPGDGSRIPGQEPEPCESSGACAAFKGQIAIVSMTCSQSSRIWEHSIVWGVPHVVLVFSFSGMFVDVFSWQIMFGTSVFVSHIVTSLSTRADARSGIRTSLVIIVPRSFLLTWRSGFGMVFWYSCWNRVFFCLFQCLLYLTEMCHFPCVLYSASVGSCVCYVAMYILYI